ncbi:hypothetical protein SELMODRAFT_428761 [Selaginella moellendorffii]|uniref:Uncharacterized protein n=1 Tax=Selaginella moellendorffii TaxID=88036 RepID=D8T3W7_SELML|nr:hypothetical protein SELMODRAFT_428761 [Selaginella moellendorffii]
MEPARSTISLFWILLPTPGGNPTFGDVPAPREGHSVSLIDDNLFVFGGYTFVWKKISTTGVSPIPRDSHTCSSYKNCFVVMGGEDGGWLLLLLTLLLTIWLPFFCEKMLREKDPSEPKLSMRKERQKYRATPFVLDKQRDADKSLVSSHGEFQAHVQPLGEKMFEARESDVFNYGYTLEASIDGKLVHGLLFSYKPGFAQAVQSYMARRKPQDVQKAVVKAKPCHICEKIGEEKAARIIKIYLRGVVHQDLKLDNILSKLNMRDKVVISTFRRYHHSEVHGS